MHEAGQQVHSHGGQAYSSGYAAGFSFASSLSGEQLQLAEQIRSPGIEYDLSHRVQLCTSPSAPHLYVVQIFKAMGPFLRMIQCGLRHSALPRKQQEVCSDFVSCGVHILAVLHGPCRAMLVSRQHGCTQQGWCNHLSNSVVFLQVPL